MRYRVAFAFLAMPSARYLTEWFDTSDEATEFGNISEWAGELHIRYIENEDGEII